MDEKRDPRGPLTTEERAAVVRLRRELKMATMKRDFLRKTTTFFARNGKWASNSSQRRGSARLPDRSYWTPRLKGSVPGFKGTGCREQTHGPRSLLLKPTHGLEHRDAAWVDVATGRDAKAHDGGDVTLASGCPR
jgi:hypothetical protein